MNKKNNHIIDTSQTSLSKKIAQSLLNWIAWAFLILKSAWQKDLSKELSLDLSTQSVNPYIAARQEWNAMFGDLVKAKYNWQRIAFIVAIINLSLTLGFLWLASQSRYIPYVVKVDALGNSNFAGYLTHTLTISPLETNAFIRRYITNTRAVIADPIAEKQALDFVYATSTENTTKILNDFYQKNSPFKTAQQITIEVVVNAVLQKSDKTWQVSWTEIQRDLEGRIVSQTHWEALLTVAQHKTNDANILNLNPLGLFVEHMSWTQQF